MAHIDGNVVIGADPEVVGCTLAEGSALLDLKSYVYYSLNEVGAFVWEALGEPVRFDQLIDRVAAEFDAPRERIAADVGQLVGQLERAGLVRCGNPT